MAGIDSDYAWLKSHLRFAKAMGSREELADKVAASLNRRIENGQLPHTLGIFGGWGTGKTTFLALLAERFEKSSKHKVVYFNSWKYAGFMEIVPSLIYKILQYGVEGDSMERSEAARRVILALGKKYGDQIGAWAKTKIGVDPVELFKDLYDVSGGVQTAVGRLLPDVKPEVVRAYYTQVDKAQDELRKALGTVTPGEEPKQVVIVLIDELDRCDPDEAFNVIKQMRVLFGMRDLPVVFVIGANAEPIGLAIKHRYGLESDSSDYEARRILEKFVDAYEDLSTTEALGPLIKDMWEEEELPWIMEIDASNVTPRFHDDVQANATAFDAITSSVPLFSNIRVLYKSYERVRTNTVDNPHLLWTKWFLEIADQIDPRFRRDLRTLTKPLQEVVSDSYKAMGNISYRVTRVGRRAKLEYEPDDKGRTLFAIFRSFFWEFAKPKLENLRPSKDPQDLGRSQALERLLADPLRVDAVLLLSLLPFKHLPSFAKLSEASTKRPLPELNVDSDDLIAQFGDALAS
jgi:KAP family P-loop domain